MTYVKPSPETMHDGWSGRIATGQEGGVVLVGPMYEETLVVAFPAADRKGVALTIDQTHQLIANLTHAVGEAERKLADGGLSAAMLRRIAGIGGVS